MDAPVFPSPSTEARGQQGYVLLDALIGVVLMSILCLGLALGMAFGGEGFFRFCFNRRLDQVEEAAGRLAEWIRKR